MDEQTRQRRTLDALKSIAAVLERLRVLWEHELGVRVEDGEEGGEPQVAPSER